MAAFVFLILFAFLLVGVPIGIALGCAVTVSMWKNGQAKMFVSIPQRIFTQTDNFPLMAVPLFILGGNIMEKGGISKRLIAFLQILLRKLAARLACICVVASAFFGAISGSNPATVAAIGGSWVCKKDDIANHDWDKITALSANAVKIIKETRS